LRPVIPITVVAAAAAVLGLAAGGATGAGRTAHRHDHGRPPLGPAAATVRGELAQLSQRALSIGPASAPVTVYEYADLICRPCTAAAEHTVVPAIASFVRSGAARFVFEPIVESPASEQYAIGAYAAGVQHRGWSYVMLAYQTCGSRLTGPAYSPSALAGALGVNRRRWRAQLRRRRWPGLIEQSARVALLGGFASYPVFIVKGPGIRRSTQPGHRSVIILRAPVTLAALTQAIIRAEPQFG
jgi:hypothetical protein